MRLRVSTLCTTILSAFALTMLPGTARPDPRQWGPDGIIVRQGHHIEWARANFRRSDGYVMIAWSDCRTGDRDIYAQLIAPDGTQVWQADGKAIVTYPYRQEDPEIVAVSGGWIIAWAEFRSDTTGDVWAQKIDDNGNPLWSATGVPVDTNSALRVNEYTVRVVPDGAGGAIVAWEGSRRNDGGNIYAQRILSNGSLGWPNTLAVVDVVGDQVGITADGDGYGGLLVAWNDGRNSNDQNIYASRVTSAGVPVWGSSGVCVSCAASLQGSVKLCPDGNGGCYVAWVDQRTGSSDDLYIQRLDSNGQAQWTVDGLLLCGAPDNQADVRVAVSMNGSTADGCLAAWQDVRVNGSTNEVYAQKISPGGAALWGTNGMKVCGDATTDPFNPGHTRDGVRLTSDMAGGMVCAWEDTRTDGETQKYDLYAARVLAGGSLAWNGQCGNLVASGRFMQFAPLLRLDSGDGVTIVYGDRRYGSLSLRYQNLDLATGQQTLNPDGEQIIYGLDGNTFNPKTMPMSNHRVGVVWQDGRYGPGGNGLFYQVVSATGQIERTVNGDTLVPDNEGLSPVTQQNHQVCSDGNGGFFVCFEDTRTGYRRIRLTRVAAGGAIAGPLTGTPIYDDGNTRDQVSAFCAPDGAGGCYVAWSNFARSYQIDVYVMRLNAACENLWPQPARLTDTPDDDIVGGIASNPDGCAAVVWQSGEEGDYNITGARVCGDGSITWGLAVCDAGNEQGDPTVAADGQGGFYFAWSDNRLPYRAQDIYAQHISSDGTELWMGDGIQVISDTLSQINPVLAVDAEHSLWVTWEDFRNSIHLDVYGQKISSGGMLAWQTSGKPICIAPGEQSDIATLPQGNDQLYAVWADNREYFPDIYGTHLDRDGDPVDRGAYWAIDSGGVVCNYYQKQVRPSMCTDGWQGYFCAWIDQRASGKEELMNVYANRVTDDTSTSVDDFGAALPAQFELSQNFPNPFNPVTRITFALPQSSRVELELFNTLGQKVVSLADGVFTAGRHEITFDAEGLASGIYFYRLKTPSYVNVKKMTLLR